jgi:hypothetical protein
MEEPDSNVINANFALNGSKPFRAKPRALGNNHAIKQVYKTFNIQRKGGGSGGLTVGVTPNGWRQRVGFEVDPVIAKAQRDYFLSVCEIVVDTKVDTQSTTALTSGTVATPGKAPANVTVQIEGMPILTGNEKNELIEYWEHSKHVHEARTRTELDLQSLEAKFPRLDYYVPLSLADLKKHSPESLAEIIIEQPEFALHILWHALHPQAVNVPRSDVSPGAHKTEPVQPSVSSPSPAATGKRRRTFVPSAA